MNERTKILTIRNLKVAFAQGRKRVLEIIRGIDLTLYEGQIVGIVGESGSGKSVSTKALMNVNFGSNTSFDEYQVLGKRFKNHKAVDWKHIRGGQIAYIPQNPSTSMNPTRKIGDQIFDVLKVYRKEFKTRDQRKKYALEILDRFRIVNPERVLDMYPHELSGGQKQRIIIGLGIMAGAKIIIADEPTTALDTTVQAAVLELLQEVNQTFKVAVIFISHNIAVIAKLCDYIYVMYAGKVVERAPKRELFTNPKHPYTWALIASIPEDVDRTNKLYSIPGTPVDITNLPVGDPFAPRNQFALAIDFKQEPPLFEVSPEHWAATWMLHPFYPKTALPEAIVSRLNQIRKVFS